MNLAWARRIDPGANHRLTAQWWRYAHGSRCANDPTNGGGSDFTLDSDTGESVTLWSLKGSPMVLYFYPKDDAPGTILQY